MNLHPLPETTVRKTWKILVIDDDEEDIFILKEMLKQARGNTFEVHWASSYKTGCEALHADHYHAALVDYDLGAETGIQLIREAIEKGYSVPLILFTGRGTYAVDLQAMEAGATLYLSKNEATPLLLERSIRYAIELKQREQALRESETKYHSLYEAMDEGFMLSEVIFDEDDQPVDILYHEANSAAVRMLGMDYTGKRLTEINPNFEPFWFEIWGRVAHTGVSERMEAYAEPLKTWYNFYIFRAGGPGSRIVANVFEDITQRKQVEARLKIAAARDAYLVKLADALRPLSDPAAIQAEAERALGEFLGVSRAMYGEVAENGADLIVEQNYVSNGAPLLTGRFRMAGFGPALVEAMNAGRTMALPDIASEPALSAAERESFAGLGIAAAVSVPLTKDGRFVANLSVHQAAPRAWTEDEIALIEETAERTWAAIERARAEKALRESEERFRTSVESLGEAFKILSAVRENGKIVDFCYEYVNEAACRLSQRTREQLLGMTMLQLMPQLRGTSIIERFAEVVESGQPILEQAFAWDFLERSKSRALYDIRITRFRDGIIMTIDDVTELVRLEAEQQKAIRDREIQRQLTEQRELERQSIARDIHDGPIQTLSGLLFNLQSLREVYTDPALQFEVDRVKLSIKGSVQELRQVMYELRPPSVIQFGLARAIQSHNENLLEIYPQITWGLALDDDGQLLPQQTCLMLFRIYQEAVNNIIRHSEARQAWVTLNVLKDQICLEIRDNGKGFVRSQNMAHFTENRHFGLAGMTERVEAINGELEIKSNPGEGTVISIKVPITNKEQ